MSEIGSGKEVFEAKEAQLERDGFKEIKPQEGTTFQEAQDFWKDMFGSEIQPEGQKYYDDEGRLYRIGDDLPPNCQYEMHGYQYETDYNGRIISAEGTLHLKDRDGRLPMRDSIETIGKGDQQEGDDRGHLIGDQFDGSNGMENMVPQDADINRNDYKNLENELAKEVKDGKEVHYMVEPTYEGDSRRPSAIAVTYSVNGEETVRIFPNGKES